MWITPCWTTIRFAADLGERLEAAFGASERARYWAIFGQLREQLGLADYLGSLQKFRTGLDDHPELLAMSEFLLEYPFTARLFPRALETVAHLRTLGLPVVLSDGDIVYQPRKIQRSGIWDAVEGRVMIYLHKERVLDHMQQRYAGQALCHGRRQAELVGRHEDSIEG
jgi:FMN phosphatase YigB (HAD superfamily)